MSSQIARINMIKQQLRTGDVLNENILDLYASIPREEFVPNQYKHFAYSDMQIPLSHDQRMMTPLEEAMLIQALELKGHETVLEIGTGTGFLTALLSRLCQKITTVDYFPEFTKYAQQKLTVHQCKNVECITGDGHQGWLDRAPYDVVIFTGGIEAITETHRLQVLPGGKLFAIVGKAPVLQAQLHTLGQDGLWTEQLIFETNLPLLINKLRQKDFVF